MCLISVLRKGTRKDTEEVEKFIRNGASCNTDGSGFAYKRNGESRITIKKGFFNVDIMLGEIKSLNLTEQDELIVHHRIGTSGRVSKENTHPFVISNVESEVSAVNITINKPVMVHNGMFYHLRDFMALNPDFSDTYAFARYVLGNPYIFGLFEHYREFFEKLFGNSIGNDKICILYPDKDLEMIGTFIENNGYYHSNYGYCRYVSNRGGEEDWGEYYGREFGDTSLSVSSVPNSKTIGEAKKEGKEGEEQEESKEEEKTEINAGLNCRFGDTLPKSKLIKLDNNKQLPTLLLDSKYITLTNRNINHFAYVEKDTWDTAKPLTRLGIIYRYINSFDPDAMYQSAHYRPFENDHGMILNEGIKTSNLREKYYYVPRGEYFNAVYSDYKELLDFKVIPTIETIRILEKLVKHEDHIMKKPYESIFYPKHSEIYCKQSLEMLIDYYKSIQNKDVNNKGFMKHLFNFSD